jgi:geranylgeranyl diphosphate synthase type II
LTQNDLRGHIGVLPAADRQVREAAVPIQEHLAEIRSRVDAALDRALPAADRDPRKLNEAMRYSVFAGGKRLRPALALLACGVGGGTEEDAMPVACALELIHTYCLIHDDLPAMDDDDLRRGKPSNHKGFGEATAILAGDALLSQAFRVVASLPRRKALPAVLEELGRATGAEGMVGGQIADLEAEGREPDRATVDFIHLHKTAALIEASLRIGALSAGSDTEVVEALGRFGRLVGHAFQILDDVLDEAGTEEGMGKPVRKDRLRGKMTYPSVLGVEGSRAKARELIAEAKACLEGLPRTKALLDLADFVIERKS